MQLKEKKSIEQNYPIPTYYKKSSKAIWFLPIISAFLFFTASFKSDDQIEATQKALLFGLVFAILVACMYLPDGLIQRPTIFMWKAITGISFFYLAILIYFAYLDKSSAEKIIHTYFDRGLKNYNYEQISYSADCRIITYDKQDPIGNIRFAFFDIFAFAHVAGWFIKALVIRDFKIVLFQSLVFQLIQYSLRDVLNNFKQCWWDHIIVDFLVCNMTGIVLGFYVIDKLKLQRYRWSFRDAPFQTTTWEQFKYFCTHWDLSKLQVKTFSNLKKFIQLSWFCMFNQANDLAVFFLKYIYQIPPQNYMVTLRVAIIGLLGVNAAKQFYRYLVRRESHLKINSFMIQMIVLTEIFISIKHGANCFSHASIPILGCVFLFVLALLYFIVFAKVLISDMIYYRKIKKNQKCDTPANPNKQAKQLVKIFEPASNIQIKVQ